jgi:hypothetical protein
VIDSTLVAVQRVRNVLRINTVFSIITGVAVAASASWLARQLGDVPTWLVAGVGMGVVAFGCAVLAISVAGARTVWRGGRLVAAADAMWVLASIPVVIFGDLTTAGVFVVVGVAVVILALAAAEIAALHAWAAEAKRRAILPVAKVSA